MTPTATQDDATVLLTPDDAARRAAVSRKTVYA
jgi:hypothetical protein